MTQDAQGPGRQFRQIACVATLPKTPSGKLQRFMLRNQEAGALLE